MDNLKHQENLRRSSFGLGNAKAAHECFRGALDKGISSEQLKPDENMYTFSLTY